MIFAAGHRTIGLGCTLTLRSLLALQVACVACACVAGGHQVSGSDFEPIFNGTDLSGWDGDPRLWRVEHGVIRGETDARHLAAGNTFLIWQGGEVADFELRFQFRCTAVNNSGVQYRSRRVPADEAPNAWVVRGYQHEIRNENKPPNVPGFIYDEGGERGRLCLAGEKATWGESGKRVEQTFLTAADVQKLIKIDQWNDARIVAEGNRIQHFLNGTPWLDFSDNHPKLALHSGVIALQIHAGAPMWAEFRHLELKRLP